ncbi:hypothetical protein TSUD_144190 [Trifolium subterraneum]|uniref:Reverse transcriptase domain-containing protein n=1 Tax=Trifolium subterraneum TaxID=3900 RepID=A0A2Z6MR48_TRISU|nr:hypothetical protein TSUD_144190 [Trifolium subterraneum]
MRVRERDRSGALRANLGWPCRSPSPAERQTQGVGSKAGCQKGGETMESGLRNRSRSRRELDRSHQWLGDISHDVCMDMVQQFDDFHHQHLDRQQTRSSAMTDGNRQQPIDDIRQSHFLKDAEIDASGFGTTRQERETRVSLGNDLKRYVSFYFTNFPAELSHFYLRKGFEVCGMLEDDYVAKKRNIYGEPYGFVRFSNVRDVNKLLKALNVVYFGHFSVHTRVARFYRNDVKEGRHLRTVKDGHKEGHKGTETAEANLIENGKACCSRADSSKGCPGAGSRGDFKESDNICDVIKEKDNRIFLRNFRTTPDDVMWAQNGIVVTIINGEAVPVVQNRITDAGFQDLILIPMGADKVFIRSSARTDALTIVNSATDFFTLLFSNWMRWGKVVHPYQRGTWVRLYGIPIHAWNVNFFKLCVFDCGRFLRADSCSTDRDRLDFARVLISTSGLEIINRVEKVLVDGALTEIKIVEEWGYTLGEDTCLFEDESGSEASQTNNEVVHDDPGDRREVDMLVEKLVDGLEKEDEIELQEKLVDNIIDMQDVNHSGNEGIVEEELQDAQLSSPSRCPGEDSSSLHSDSPGDCGDKVLRIGNPLHVLEDQVSSSICKPSDGVRNIVGARWPKGPIPNPPRTKQVLFSASKSLKKGGYLGVRQQKEGQQDVKRKKVGGLFRHSLYSLKKVVRIPSKDRNEVLDVLKKNVRRHKGGKGTTQAPSDDSTSSAAVNNDWKHWVVMQGGDQAVEDDVRGIGNAIGVKYKGNSENMFKVLSRTGKGASGGLLSIWDTNEVEVWSTESRDHVLWCHGRFINSGDEFYVENVYAPCDDRAKQGLWESLSVRLQSLGRQRVCLYGDFNAVKSIEERRSSRGVQSSRDLIPFNRFIDENNLIDLPLSGRSQDEWMLKCVKDILGYNLFVRDKWNSFHIDGWGGFLLKEKLKMIKAALKDWHLAHTQNLPSQIDSLKTQLSALDLKGEEEDLTEAELVELHGVTFDIHSLSRLHASVCWQQFRSRWLKEGDANSKYFHSVLASRRRGNVISSIMVNGVSLEGVSPVRQAVVSHFASHFKATTLDRPGVDNLPFKMLNAEECISLTKPFSVAEVKAVVWDCDSYKSSGPDGINIGFIKDFWPELQGDVMRFISEFHWNGKLTKGLNSTFIALIPKVENPQRLNDFQPISLVGCLYKILAKVLANRLRLVIGRVISESQTTFVKYRQIFNGILIANEVVDEARRRYYGKNAFPNLWRKWIKECVCTATASVLVNGSPTDEFPLERGLRQGDLLSPFLFLLATEGLNVLMKTMVERNRFTGWANIRALRAALMFFESMSGLKVNFNKSMLVGVNIPESWLCEAASALRCKVGKIPFLYLGLPIGGDSGRLSFWEPVLTHLKNRLSGWKSRLLSFGGRLILLNSLQGEGREIESRGRSGSSWWREIARIRDSGGGIGGAWFGECISKTLGDGVGAGRGVWVWRRQLRGWEEEMFSECQNLLLNISLQIPLKVSILAWRLLRDTLPTKAKLVTRGILSPEAHYCVSGCGAIESAQHLFLSCSTSGSLWSLVSSWIGSSLVDSHTISNHFTHFTHSAGVSRAHRSFMQLIWLANVWVVWNERNFRLFRGSASSLHHMLHKINFFSYRWLKVTSSTLALNYHS